MERSFDAYSWQTVEHKAKFIVQVTRGRLDVRAIEDIGDQALSYTEVKALASGDPLILEQARAQNDVTRLERLERAFHRNREQLRYALTSAVEREKARGRDVEAIDTAIGRREDTRADRFAMTIYGATHTDRGRAADALIQWALRAPMGRLEPIGTLGGLDVDGVVKMGSNYGVREAFLTFHGLPEDWAHATLSHLAESPLTLVRQLEYRVTSLENRRAEMVLRQQDAAQDVARAREGLERPFKYTEDLETARSQLAGITQKMQASTVTANPVVGEPTPEPGPDPASGQTGTPRRFVARPRPRPGVRQSDPQSPSRTGY